MAKKSTRDTTGSAAAPRRAAPRRAGKTDTNAATPAVEIASVTSNEPIQTAADDRAEAPRTPAPPDYDEIARTAYMRYLSRGGADGRDFDDWIEAERELADRNAR